MKNVQIGGLTVGNDQPLTLDRRALPA
jgi:hypothetical protein